MQLSPRARSVLAGAVVVLLALATWWLQAGEPDGSTRSASDTTSAEASVSPSPSGPPSSAPDTSSAPSATATGPATDPDSGLPYVDLAVLPVEAAETVDLIDAGGPFPYPDKDGSTFGNYEGLLPDRDHGYYAEYTVPTPGSDDRGARRIVAGDAGELYWTEDHYESFERIRR